MDERINCLRCHTPMELGIIADATYGANVQEQWTPGVPTTSVWTGLKLNKRERIPVTTMRCPKCGALESYARPAE